MCDTNVVVVISAELYTGCSREICTKFALDKFLIIYHRIALFTPSCLSKIAIRASICKWIKCSFQVGNRFYIRTGRCAITDRSITVAFLKTNVTDFEPSNWPPNSDKGSPLLKTSIGFTELILVLGSQPAGDRSHRPGGRLPLLSRPMITSPAAEHHHPLAGTKLYCLVIEAHV